MGCGSSCCPPCPCLGKGKVAPLPEGTTAERSASKTTIISCKDGITTKTITDRQAKVPKESTDVNVLEKGKELFTVPYPQRIRSNSKLTVYGEDKNYVFRAGKQKNRYSLEKNDLDKLKVEHEENKVFEANMSPKVIVKALEDMKQHFVGYDHHLWEKALEIRRSEARGVWGNVVIIIKGVHEYRLWSGSKANVLKIFLNEQKTVEFDWKIVEED